jgi:hypothetical protein
VKICRKLAAQMALKAASMAAAVKIHQDKPATFEAGPPVPLFQTHIVGGASANNVQAQYVVSHDGRFLINQPVEEPNPPPITLILNWKSKP